VKEKKEKGHKKEKLKFNGKYLQMGRKVSMRSYRLTIEKEKSFWRRVTGNNFQAKI
jgi:hypothetical protein